MGRRGVNWSGCTRSFGQMWRFGGGSIAILVNGGRVPSLGPSGPAGEVWAAPDLRAST